MTADARKLSERMRGYAEYTECEDYLTPDVIARHIKEYAAEVAALEQRLALAEQQRDEALKDLEAAEAADDCPNCPNRGWYLTPVGDDDVEQTQCEFCHSHGNSRFNHNRDRRSRLMEDKS